MRKIIVIWTVVILASLLSHELYAIKSRHARRRERKADAGVASNIDYTTTVSVEGQDSSQPADLMQFFATQEKIPLDETGATQNVSQPLEAMQVSSQDDRGFKDEHDFVVATKNSSASLPEEINILLSEEKDVIEFHFEDAGIEQLITQIEQLFGITFITGDTVKPALEGTKSLKGAKISFKTQNPLNKKQAWNLFTTFLQLAGFSVVPDAQPRIFHIVVSEKAKKEPIPTFIGTDPAYLPDSNQVIRFVYFVENSALDVIKSVIEPLRSGTSSLIFLEEIKAFLLIDHAYNIKSLMRIVKELDKVTIPQAMSVLKLKRADAQDVKQLYDALIQKENAPAAGSRLFPRKIPTARYFPESIKIIAEPRTNTLILLGPPDAIKKIEQFIIEHVDTDLDHPYSPLNVYSLKYAEAETIAKIMNDMVQLGKETQAGRVGGVRGNDKYFRDITFTPEPKTNRLIIKGEQDDYEKAINVIRKLDEPQPQVAIEVLILTVQLREGKELGMQIRSRESQGGGSGLLGDHLKFQTSGLRAGGSAKGIVTNPNGSGVNRLLGDLINLVVGAPAGNSIITLGNDLFGVWGVLQMLDTVSNTEILANPFLTTTNKATSTVSVGEKRRVVTGTIIGTNQTETLGDEPAELKVTVTPQINSDGMIVLKLNISITAFTPDSDQVNVAKTTREIDTETTVADREVLAIGGLIQNKIDNNASSVPLLSEIPLLGWLFKNRRKAQDKNNLLILLSCKIINPPHKDTIEPFTQEKIVGYHHMLASVRAADAKRDPIHRAFFGEKRNNTDSIIDDFLFMRQKQLNMTTPIAPNQSVNAHHTQTQAVLPVVEPVTQKQPISVSMQPQRRIRKRHSLTELVANEPKDKHV